MKKQYFILIVLGFLENQATHKTTHRSSHDISMRNLTIISDVINQDDDPNPDLFTTFFENKVITPGPTGDILRDAMREECSPIFVSGNLFQRCYNFCMFAHDLVELEVAEFESIYGKRPIRTNFQKDNFVACLKKLVHFLIQQHAAAQNFITASLKSKHEPHAIQAETLSYLRDNKLTSQDYQALSKNLKVDLYPQLNLLAHDAFAFYNSFKPENWTVYSTKNNNYFMVPKGYPEGDFSRQRLSKAQLGVMDLPIDLNISKSEVTFMGQLFVEELDTLINGVPTSHKKPLVVFMAGHGGLPQDKFSSGLSLHDFHNLVTALGRGNTYAFFYLTCHAGGTTTQSVWFNQVEPNSRAVADAIYHAPFITIVTPATEIAFSRNSPFWLQEFEANYEEYFAPWFLTPSIPPVITLPRLKDYFRGITTSLPKALENSLYAPLYTIYRDQRSIIIPQAALIRFPGTEWFAPQFFYETVFDINKTKSAKALYEQKPLIQPMMSNVITITTPTIYAPLIIHQNDDLRIVPLLSLDPSYATTRKHITYISQLVIEDSIYKGLLNQLWNLSYTNIGPCMIVPQAISGGSKNEIQKICVIENVVGTKGKLIATRFTITPQGTFYIDPATQRIMRLIQSTKSSKSESSGSSYTSNYVSKTGQEFFEKVQATVERFLQADRAAKNSSQTVVHKYRAMKALDAMLKKRLHG